MGGYVIVFILSLACALLCFGQPGVLNLVGLLANGLIARYAFGKIIHGDGGAK